MKKFRVLFTLLIAVALVFTLSACGGTDGTLDQIFNKYFAE